MPLYSHTQLKLLLTLAGTLLVGIGVREWRAGFPDLAERLERFDREEPSVAIGPIPRTDTKPSRAAKLATAAAAPTAGAAADPPGPSPTAPRDATRRVDLNRATAAELAQLPGIGPVLADRITAERERRGRFDSPEALRAVLGMGPKKLAAIRELLTVDP